VVLPERVFIARDEQFQHPDLRLCTIVKMCQNKQFLFPYIPEKPPQGNIQRIRDTSVNMNAGLTLVVFKRPQIFG